MEFKYKLMFEDRSISIYAYNIEMVLAEKLETDVSRGTVKAFIFSLFNHQALDIFPEDKKIREWIIGTYDGHPDSPFTKEEVNVLKNCR